MSYLKIIGEDTKYYVTLNPFTSQHGHKAIRFIGEKVPETDKGFEYYNDNNILITDLSEYRYQYRPNEYTIEQDIIELPKGSYEPLPPSAIDRLSSRINKVSNRVSQTEYKENNLEQSVADLEDSLCEYSMDVEQSLADIEDSICELSEMDIEESEEE